MKESRNIWETVRTSSHPNVVAYSDPSIILTYPPNLLFRYSASFTVVPCCFLLRELHRRIFSLLPLAEAEKERQRTLRVPRIEQPRLGCSIFRRRTNVSLLCFSVTDGEPMVWYFFQ